MLYSCRLLPVLLSALLLAGSFPAAAFSCNTYPSQPASAVFYPDEVQLTVEESLEPVTLPSGRKGLVISLPSGAMRDSFMLSVGGVPAQGYYWPERDEREAVLALCGKQPVPNFSRLPENETSVQRKALLEKLVPLAEDVARKEGALRATQSRLELWQKAFDQFNGNAGGKISPADEAVKLTESYAQQYPGLFSDAEMQGRALEDARNLLARAEKELLDFDRLTKGEVVVVPVDAADKQDLSYAYVLPASCNISYRLDARPDKSEFSVNQDVALQQHSGFAWKNVDLYVSTVRRDKTLRPVNIWPWKISVHDKSENKPRPAIGQVAQKSMRMQEYQAAMPEVMMDAAPAAAPEPVQQERGTFRLWSLGKQTMDYGAPVNLSLASDVHQAKFHYTLRPINNPKGFLTAEVALSKPLELPPGMAQFSVDGAVMGRQMFSFNGDKGIIFFGSDPQVTATMRDLQQTSGEQGFFSKEQTRSWHWQITLKSTRPNPVNVVLEDPAPVTEVEAVNIITQSMPRPEETVNEPKYGGARVYRWNLTLQPGEAQMVDHQIQLVAPLMPDKVIEPGR